MVKLKLSFREDGFRFKRLQSFTYMNVIYFIYCFEFDVRFYTLIYCDRRFVNESYCIYIYLTLPLKIEYTNIFGKCVCCILIKILVFRYEKLHFKCTHTICCSILNNMILWLKCQVFPLLAVNWENIFAWRFYK